MADPTYDVDIGTAFALSLACLDENRDAVDLTGYTAYGSMKTSATSDTVTLDLAPTIPTPANGIVVVNASTVGLTAGQYVFDVLIKTGSNLPIKIGWGIIKLKRKVTSNP
jgi:hypothetical protein